MYKAHEGSFVILPIYTYLQHSVTLNSLSLNTLSLSTHLQQQQKFLIRILLLMHQSNRNKTLSNQSQNLLQSTVSNSESRFQHQPHHRIFSQPLITTTLSLTGLIQI
ncbi:hypothetical protein HanIR_Chr02g0055041 [Helianthus annuus]|nr:hypothetical protein HanIR_Chr02g0055041 [Helianthus annuus]